MLIPNAPVSFSSVTDGLSNVLLLSEISTFAVDSAGKKRRIDAGNTTGSFLAGTSALNTPPYYVGPSPASIPPSYNLTTIRYALNTVNYSLPGVFESTGPNNPLASEHPGGVDACFADGSVRLISDSVSMLVLKRMATRDDGGIIAD